jgi:hypothetical protein
MCALVVDESCIVVSIVIGLLNVKGGPKRSILIHKGNLMTYKYNFSAMYCFVAKVTEIP